MAKLLEKLEKLLVNDINVDYRMKKQEVILNTMIKEFNTHTAMAKDLVNKIKG